MEDASKALILAASVLLGLMIISLGIYIFSMYGDYTSSAYKQMEAAQINQFNAQFLKYYGTRFNETTNKEEPITCTMHDIISLANLAKNYNYQMEISDEKNETSNRDVSQHIRIDVGKQSYLENMNDDEILQKLQNESQKTTHLYGSAWYATWFNTIYYKCTELTYNTVNKKVNYMKFVQTI